ncbi:MAG: HlyD family efflux transporter periplasmic adaptor subunit [Clostridiales bacterium]|nr:HlyD family efflux transporter periplasmic adaptor subunit [Clostridiales bacterium]
MSETKPKSPIKRKWIKRTVIILILVVVFGGIYALWKSYRDNLLAQSLLQDTVRVESGDISLIVQAGGTISHSRTENLKSPTNGVIEEIFVRTGDAVQKGDVIFTVHNDQLEDEIIALEKELEALDMSLLGESSRKSSSVRSPVAGRIKGIYVQKGDDLAAVSPTLDGVILISPDDLLVVTLPADPRATVNDAVTVHIGDITADGRVTATTEESLEITFSDHSFAVGEVASVTDSGDREIGTGEIRVKTPYYVPASVGVVSSIPVSVDSTVSLGSTLIRLEEPVHSAPYLRLLESRQEIVEKLSEKRSESAVTSRTAPEDGIITQILIMEDTEVLKDTPVVALSVSDSLELTVRVDELDIASIEIGQSCKVYLNALDKSVFNGSITWISKSASASTGSAQYPVTVQIEEPTDILAGMSARVEIMSDQRTNVLLIPSLAIQNIDGKMFVMVADEADENGQTADQGRQFEIETGLSDGANTEVISGLQEGDRIILPAAETGFAGFLFR